MKNKYLVVVCFLLIAATLMAQQQPTARRVIRLRGLVDLTHALNASTPTYEESKEPAFRATTVATLEKEHYFAREICLPEHFGTHLDAPAHFAKGLWTVDQIPTERLMGRLSSPFAMASASEANPDNVIWFWLVAPAASSLLPAAG